MLAAARTVALWGLNVIPVEVEVDIGDGLPRTQIVGLPDSTVRESIDRLLSAFHAAGLEYPDGRVVVNLAPTDLRKVGSHYDLPIAAALAQACGHIPRIGSGNPLLMGELGLDGRLRPVSGVLNAARWARRHGIKSMVVPTLNGAEVQAAGVEPWAAENLVEALDLVSGRTTPKRIVVPDGRPRTKPADLKDVRGQSAAKRALEIAGAGGHSLLMVGPPGAGKTLLARCLLGILPDLTPEEALEATCIHEAAGQAQPGRGLLTKPPLRSPHHTVSAAALIGGGAAPRPGEVSLAHHGVLFLDELPEFKRDALEALRQPLEERRAVVSRAKYTTEFPASFLMVAAMNPCPCGNSGDDAKVCTCPASRAEQYRRKISGPLLDRVDLQIRLARVPVQHLSRPQEGEGSSAVAARVRRARSLQLKRQGCVNGRLSAKDTEQHCTPDTEARLLLERAMDTYELSARAYHRLLRTARTVADLEGTVGIHYPHMAEALPFRTG